MSTVVRLHRDIPASPDKVYRAWLDPDLLRRWMAPGGLEVTRAEVEPAVGGRYRIWHADAGTDVGGFDCELLELEQDRRIVWRWGFVGPQRTDAPHFDSLLTVTPPRQAGRRDRAHPRTRAVGGAGGGAAAGGRERRGRLGVGAGQARGGGGVKLVVVEWMSLDGVVQAPGAPDEDPSGGFAHGGWHLRWFDDTSRQWVVDNLNAATAFLFGRRTYDRGRSRWSPTR